MARAAQILVALLLTVPIAACSGKGPVNASAPAGAASGGVDSGSAALGAATFSAQVDGQPVSGGAIDPMQQQNAAYTLPGASGAAPLLLFYLYDSKIPNDPNFTHSFRFQLTKAGGPASDAHLTLNVILDPTHSARYDSSSPTITITSLTATRVAGTFSGKLSASPDSPNAKPEVTVTDGKFDIPMATSTLAPS
jgi:hypothetical protein